MKYISFIFTAILLVSCSSERIRNTIDFNEDWQFTLAADSVDHSTVETNDSSWRTLTLPHDWSIEGDFSESNPATPGGGALPGGTGWYRKTFSIEKELQGKQIYIDFDGVYRNSEVWINGYHLGKRPNGYISFRYDLTPFIKFGEKNVIAVKADNAQQPNSRWYSGSGIYRNVRLEITEPIHVALWGTYVTTPEVSEKQAVISIETTIENKSLNKESVTISHVLSDMKGKKKAETSSLNTTQTITVNDPKLWSIEDPYMYKILTTLEVNGKTVDEYETPIGIRSFSFDADKGFILNGKKIKINGVCNHSDLGCLGTAINVHAIERQLRILKEMGCNGIRCSHNPPAPELLDLCDKMGFIVMDESFDMWRKKKSPYDYSLDFPEWYEKDLTDLILRDRNHPSVFMWSIGNEVLEQWTDARTDTLNLKEANILLNQKKEIDPDEFASGKVTVNSLLTTRLANIVKALDPTRPVTAGCNEPRQQNHLFLSGALDIIGINYHEKDFETVHRNNPDKPFIVAESVSALMSRGHYQMPSDSIFVWPDTWDRPFVVPGNQCSSYDNCHVPWGSTHEVTWNMVKKSDYISGQYIWTGFDYLGEPTPYWWPSRSSYFGIIDLAGFPKDIYYMYQSEWSDKNVLHVFPHWNHKPGDTVDIWAYYNNADETELFLNGKSLGTKKKSGDQLHVCWRVPFEPGTLKAVSRKNGKEILTKEIKTAGEAVAIRLTSDKQKLRSDGKDLAFVTVEVIDKDGNSVPTAQHLIRFEIEGSGIIAGTDNGDPTDPVSLKKPERNLFNGKALAVVQSTKQNGKIKLKATASGLKDATIVY